MAVALPRHIQLKLDQTLAQWPHWRCEPALAAPPRVVGRLGTGISNFSVLVESGRRFVVRIDGINPAANGLNRQAEWRALQSANTAGLAPAPRYYNPELGSLVCDYLLPETDQPLCLEDVAGLLFAIHQMPARHNRLDLGERIARYEKSLTQAGAHLPGALQRSRAAVLENLEQLERQPEPGVLCHNDLLRANRLYSGGKLWALDWEYCAMGSRWYDLAVVVVGDSLNKADSEALLKAYLGHTASAAEQAKLHGHCLVYRYLELLWYQSQQPDTPVTDRLVALERALSA